MIADKLNFALAGFCLMGGLSLTGPIVEHLIAPEPKSIPVEGRYLPAPGNRTTCPELNQKGEPYVGWVSGQADGSDKPVKTVCVYAAARAV